MPELAILGLLATGWCALHSLLIAAPVTRVLEARLGSAYHRLYRIAYNLIALATLVVVVRYEAGAAGEVLIAWEGWWLAPRALLIGAAFFFFLAGAERYDMLRFLGVRQLVGERPRQGLTATGDLDTSGILGVVRHPWYLGALLAIWARTPKPGVLVTNAVLSLYLVLGAMLEERKLVLEFGEAYRDYQRRVPMLVPWRRPRART